MSFCKELAYKLISAEFEAKAGVPLDKGLFNRLMYTDIYVKLIRNAIAAEENGNPTKLDNLISLLVVNQRVYAVKPRKKKKPHIKPTARREAALLRELARVRVDNTGSRLKTAELYALFSILKPKAEISETAPGVFTSSGRFSNKQLKALVRRLQRAEKLTTI